MLLNLRLDPGNHILKCLYVTELGISLFLYRIELLTIFSGASLEIFPKQILLNF